MKDRILDSVVEITEQRNSISLGHCVLATLTEMMPVINASLTYYIANTKVVLAEVTLNRGSGSYQWQYENSGMRTSQHDHEAVECDIYKTCRNTHTICYPIPISSDCSAELIVEMDGDIEEYHLLIDGFAKIYKNYLVVLHESERDKLTGLLNRRTLEERLTRCFDLVPGDVDGLNMWVAIIDLDHFKNINDTFGHMIGDEVLLLFAQQMQNYFCNNEQLFRFGGEEFVIIFPPQEKQQVLNTLENFRSLIEQYRFPQVNKVTFSCGLCVISRTQYLPTILDHADKALYFAKESGRNQIQCYEDLSKASSHLNDDDLFDEAELF
ncbi:sensory box/GGDEF family protein [Vibrio orientalis CIP 102891 = ATCC 33934]|uniref:diguanylate cyclase n=1 Tax=Vibrio orientalis CIP 102891 = ATCC 33934 TaxID=675816 RepID=C9QIA8_VIBOR|nr:GGDEF domain-containing protein [Vibrio orientalis]EEX92567.1 GGDEF family protein [Vibrio orientalis CIP 102891 = ATCC 33934]EGU49717.1 sensory box/GGDEF family protein [Vibrio orientalis CIP 102891 = ATCC 33934]